MAQQTAVEWLVEQVNSDCLNSTFIQYELVNKAKEMERIQIKKAYTEGIFSELKWRNEEQYYNETYNK